MRKLFFLALLYSFCGLLFSCGSGELYINCKLPNGSCEFNLKSECENGGGIEVSVCKNSSSSNLEISSSSSSILSVCINCFSSSSQKMADKSSGSADSNAIINLLLTPHREELLLEYIRYSDFSGNLNSTEATKISGLRPTGTVYAYVFKIYLPAGGGFSTMLLINEFKQYSYLFSFDGKTAKLIEESKFPISYTAMDAGYYYYALTSVNPYEIGHFSIHFRYKE